MKTRLLAFATELEAQETVRLLKARQGPKPHLYHFQNGKIVITGMGMAKAAAAVAFHLSGIDEVWNCGLAGTLQDTLPLGNPYGIATISKHLSLPSLVDEHTITLAGHAYPLITLPHEGLRLVTSDYPIHHEGIRTTLAQHADLVDMEGYGVATAAAHAHVPCHLYKVVSDFAKVNGQHLIKQKMSEYSAVMAAFLETALENSQN